MIYSIKKLIKGIIKKNPKHVHPLTTNTIESDIVRTDDDNVVRIKNIKIKDIKITQK